MQWFLHSVTDSTAKSLAVDKEQELLLWYVLL